MKGTCVSVVVVVVVSVAVGEISHRVVGVGTSDLVNEKRNNRIQRKVEEFQ